MKYPVLITAIWAVLSFLPSAWAQRDIVIPEGTNVVVRLTDRLSSDVNQTGDRFNAVLDQDLVIDGRVAARQGSEAFGELVEVRDAGKVSGRARMALTLTGIRTDGALIPLETNTVTVEADPNTKRDAGMIGGGAALGAIIGAIAGGGKGAAIGAAVGAAAGTGGVLVTGGRDVVFEAEQRFNFVVLGGSGNASVYGRDDERYGQGSYDVRRIEEIAGSLRDDARQALAAAERRGELRDRAGDRVYQDLRRFSADADRFYGTVRSSSSVNLRAEARRLVRQAENLDAALERTNISSSFRDRWFSIQESIARLGGEFNIRYANDRYAGDRNLARTDPYYDLGSSSYSRGRLRWQGRVDGSDIVMLRENQVMIRHISAQRVVDPSYNLTAPLPREAVQVSLRTLEGRGRVELIEQPSARNNYTAQVRIDDNDPGDDLYVFELIW